MRPVKQAEIKLPRASLLNPRKRIFAIEGRAGEWKLYRGNRRPSSVRSGTQHHKVAVYQTPRRELVREFIRLRKFDKIDDTIFLERLRAGHLRVDKETGRIFSCLGSFGRLTEWTELKQETSDNGYRFVRIYRGESRKKIAVHRLVVMSDIEGAIPDGYDIDHRDCNRLNNSISNLRLRESTSNRATNCSGGEEW